MSNEISFRGFFQLLTDRWRTFLIVGLVAIALSAVFSGPAFITPQYRSSAIVYPVNLNRYSTETPTDQLLQLLESNSIRDSLMLRYQLAEHYDIDTTVAPGKFWLYNEFNDRVSISKTRYESVQIEIIDEDPVLAQKLVLGMLHQADLLARRLQREKSQEVLLIADHELRKQRRTLDSVNARLDTLRQRTGLLSFDGQSEEVTRGYMRLLNSGSSAGREEARRMLDALGRYGEEFRTLMELSDNLTTIYVERIKDMDRAELDMTKELTYSSVLVYPEVADKKVFPVRWLIVLISTVSALFLAFVLMAWRDQRS